MLDVSSDARLHQRPQTGGQLRAEWVVLPKGVAGVELRQDVGAQPVPVAPAVDLYGRLQSGGCAGTEPIPDARGHFVNLVKEAALVDHTLLEKNESIVFNLYRSRDIKLLASQPMLLRTKRI